LTSNHPSSPRKIQIQRARLEEQALGREEAGSKINKKQRSYISLLMFHSNKQNKQLI